MTRQDLHDWLTRHGYSPTARNTNAYVKTERRRYRLTDLGLRFETQVIHSDGSKEWIRIRSAYYKNLTLNDKDQLCGMSPRGM